MIILDTTINVTTQCPICNETFHHTYNTDSIAEAEIWALAAGCPNCFTALPFDKAKELYEN